jgi:hypothetical protein
MSARTLKFFCAWNRLRQWLCRAMSRRKAAANSPQPRCRSRRKTRRVFFEMP